MAEHVLDNRSPSKGYPQVFAAYDALPPGGAFVLVDDRDPEPLREAFEVEHPGSHTWEDLHRGPDEWRVRIRKLAATPLPRVLCDTSPGGNLPRDPDTAGAVWRLRMRDRDLDSNIIQLPAGDGIDAHTGPDLDVLLHVLDGGGTLTTELGEVPLTPGAVVWLPKRSRREFRAGPDGLRYLTVHQRRREPGLRTIDFRERD